MIFASGYGFDLCMPVFVCVLVFVRNYTFPIAYVGNHVRATVECKAVYFDMIKLICDYSYRVITVRGC